MKSITVLFAFALSGFAFPSHSFGWKGKSFLLDGKPFQIRSGEMHYARVPRGYWRDRLKKLRAMGLNTVCTYMFWNAHEPQSGKFDFSDNLDIREFCKVAQEEGVWVIIRPGPYACAEWEWGGYPYWLANYPKLKVRSTDPRFLAACRQYMSRVGREIAPYQVTRGGPILMVQVENEYGSFGNDKVYLGAMRDMIRASGIDVPLFTSDGASPQMLNGGTLPDVLSVINFGSNPRGEFAELDKFRPDTPHMCGEFYPGWFDSWGEPHAHTTTADKARDVDTMMQDGDSFSVYMFHGGTTRGFMNGANIYDGRYLPQTSCYDYSTTLDEAGRPTDKFFAFRDAIAAHLPPGETIPPLPAANPIIEVPGFKLTEFVPVFSTLPKPVSGDRPKSFEELGQAYGFVLYHTLVKQGGRSLKLEGLQDRAQVFVNGEPAGVLDRMRNKYEMPVSVPPGTPLDLLVENLGRVNYSQALVDERKGFRAALLDGQALTGWDMYRLPMNKPPTTGFRTGTPHGPCFARATFVLDKVGDTFFDMRAFSKGVVWVNGHNLGRYWHIGPQQSLYVPAVWLKKGSNEVTVLELNSSSDWMMLGLKDSQFFLTKNAE